MWGKKGGGELARMLGRGWEYVNRMTSSRMMSRGRGLTSRWIAAAAMVLSCGVVGVASARDDAGATVGQGGAVESGASIESASAVVGDGLLRRVSPAVLEALNDDDFAQREAATRALLRDNRVDIELIERCLAQPLTWEQRDRLMRVAEHHVLRSLRLMHRERLPGWSDGGASIGLTQAGVPAGEEPGVDRHAIRVMQTFPGFPAHAVLEPGDLIVAVDGRGIAGIGDAMGVAGAFGELIRSYKPGQTIRLSLVRSGRAMDVDVELASYNVLVTMYDGQADPLVPTYRALWDAHRRRLERIAADARAHAAQQRRLPLDASASTATPDPDAEPQAQREP